MYYRKVAVIALLLIPAVASAQRRMRGETRANWDGIDASPAGPRVTKGDIESFSGLRILVDKRKDLKLSDEQVKRLKDLAKAEEETNASQFKTFDSLKTAAKPRAGAPRDEERARTTIAREEILRVIEEIRDSYDSTLKEGLLALEEPQRQPATELVDKEREEAEKNLREKFGGRGSGTGRAGARVPFRVPRGAPPGAE